MAETTIEARDRDDIGATKEENQFNFGAGEAHEVDPRWKHPGEWQYMEDGMLVTRTSVWSAPGCHEGCGVLVYSDPETGKFIKCEGDPDDPYKLNDDEEQVMRGLSLAFLQNEKLQRHVRFMMTHGALYQIVNGNLMYHGCIPMNEDGTFKDVEFMGKTLHGKAYMDYLDSLVREAYFREESPKRKGKSGDLMWYLWLSANSPLFGKDQMTTFERCFIDDKKSHKEHTVPYYKLINEQEVCENILKEFGLNPEDSVVLNGHVPVKIKDGESPVKGGGRLFIIDGGMSKAYQKTTGIAGYTFIYNSRYMALSEHKPYSPLKPDGTQVFHSPVITIVKNMRKRMLIQDTDIGKELMREREELKELVAAYRSGAMKQKNSAR